MGGNATTTSLNTNDILSGGITTSGTGITGSTQLAETYTSSVCFT